MYGEAVTSTFNIKISSVFANVVIGPKIEVFDLTRRFNEDKHPDKVNLSVGAYRTAEAKPWVLPVVKAVSEIIINDESLNHEYLPVTGDPQFTKLSTELLLGQDSPALLENRGFGVQALSGTGALRLGGEFLVRKLKRTHIYYSEPTWENHFKVFTESGFKEIHSYTYWDPIKKRVDIEGLVNDLDKVPAESVIVLHACAHNPTGCDPTKDDWKKIADIMEKKKLFPFFDSAYQGFASGDPIHDSFAVRYFVSRGFELFCAQSYAKNFGLYNERIGCLVVVQKDTATSEAVKSQLTLLACANYATPPAFGSRIVGRVLGDEKLRLKWMENVNVMSSRIIRMRKLLFNELIELKTPGTWTHITEQIGMFSYTGLNLDQVNRLISEYHIYLLSTGRINMCGLNENNVKYVASAIDDVVRGVSKNTI